MWVSKFVEIVARKVTGKKLEGPKPVHSTRKFVHFFVFTTFEKTCCNFFKRFKISVNPVLLPEKSKITPTPTPPPHVFPLHQLSHPQSQELSKGLLS
jgi:hypothetical protein